MSRMQKWVFAASFVLVLAASAPAWAHEQPFTGRITGPIFFDERTPDGHVQAFEISGNVAPLADVRGYGVHVVNTNTGQILIGFCSLTNARGTVNLYYVGRFHSDRTIDGLFFFDGGGEGAYERHFGYGVLGGGMNATSSLTLTFNGIINHPE